MALAASGNFPFAGRDVIPQKPQGEAAEPLCYIPFFPWLRAVLSSSEECGGAAEALELVPLLPDL